MNLKKILVVVAMEVEAKVLLEKLDNYVTIEKLGFTFYEGKIEGVEIIILLSGVGVINASSGMMVAMMEYKPDIVINYGIAGAMSKNIHTRDVVIGTFVSNINSYRTDELKEGEGSIPNTWELMTFLSGEKDRYIEYESNDYLLKFVKDINYFNGNVIYGKIGSGDCWNREVDRILYLNNKYDILVEDMESIAVYTVCSKYKVPVIAIKIISDNSLIGESYDREVGSYLQNFIYEYLYRLIKTRS